MFISFLKVLIYHLSVTDSFETTQLNLIFQAFTLLLVDMYKVITLLLPSYTLKLFVRQNPKTAKKDSQNTYFPSLFFP